MTAATPHRPRIRIATRGSKLALWQANYVASALQGQGYDTELVVIKTQGDIVQNRFLHEIGGKGLFVKELEQAMQRGEADIAVHSLKDLPARVPHGFHLAAILKRHSPLDALILRDGLRLTPHHMALSVDEVRSLGPLTIATGSLRRQALLKRHHPDLKLEGLRGNVDTRLGKLQAGQWDGIILAGASLERLGIHDVASYALADDWFIPSAAQGALAIETLAKHDVAREAVAFLNDPATRQAVSVEREVLALMGGDCTMPFGCYARASGDATAISAIILDKQGDAAISRLSISTPLTAIDVADEGLVVARDLMAQGAERILRSLGLPTPSFS